MKINPPFLIFSRFSVRSILDRLIEITCLAIVFLIPVWFAYFFPTYNIFELNKIVLFKFLVWLLLLWTLLKVIFYPPRLLVAPRVFFRRYWLLPIIFILGLSSTLLSSINPVLSFFGIMERQAGLSSYLFYFLWFILASFNLYLLGQKAMGRLVITAVASGSLVAVYGILQILNIDFLSWPEPPFISQRAFSSLGQPNFLASWLLLTIPLSFYLVYNSHSRPGRLFYGFLALLQLIGLFLTGSRGGLFSGLATAAIFLVYELIISARLRSWPRRRKIIAFTAFLISAAILFVGLNYFSNGRVRSLLDYQSGSSGARLNFYNAAADAIKERPILGYGLETGGEIFIRYYQPDWGIFGDVAQTADRAHNLFLDILLTTGALGLILFIGLYYFFFSLARDNIHQQKYPALSLALASGAIGYLISLMFSFTIVSGEVYFWLFLAILVAINASNKNLDRLTPENDDKKNSRQQDLSFLLKAVISAILVILIGWQIIRLFSVLRADFYFNKIYYLLSGHDYPAALSLTRNLENQETNPVLRESYNLFQAEELADGYNSITAPEMKAIVGKKLIELDRSLPAINYKNLLVKAKINNVLGNFLSAQSYLTRLTALSPHWPPAYLEQGNLATAAGQWREAIIAYHLAQLNLPAADDQRLNDAHRQIIRNYQFFINRQIADIYLAQDNYGAAEKYYQDAYQNNPADYTILKKIADTYYLRGDLAKAIEYNKRGIIRSPKDYHWFLALAVLYGKIGDEEQAEAFYQQALALAPAGEKIDDLKLK